MSNDIMRNASVSAEEIVRADVFAVVGETEDIAFLRSAGTVKQPRGLRYAVDQTLHTYAAVQAGAVATLAEVRAERAKAVRKLKDAKIPMTNCAWIATPRTEQFLVSVVDGLGNAVYEDEIGSGKWGGYPIRFTTQIPDTLNLGGGSNESELYFTDFAQVLIGESMGLSVEVFPNATYEEGGVVKSGISRDQSVIRAIEKVDFGLRHPKCGVVAHTLKWGA